MNYGASVERSPWCCGVMEAGHFQKTIVEIYRDFQADSAEGLFKKIMEVHKGHPVMFNFLQALDWKGSEYTYESPEYEMAELREEVKKHPKAMNIATFVNPNSGNRVDSWVIFEGEEKYYREDDNYDD